MAYAQLQVVPNPSIMEFRDWADTVIGYNAGLHTQLSGDMEWRDFADRLSLLYPAAPRGESFLEWRGWADALRMSLQL